MSKFAATCIALLVLLVTVQTWRLGEAKQAVRDVQTSRPVPHVTEPDRTSKSVAEAPRPGTGSAEQLLGDAAERASGNATSGAGEAAGSSGAKSMATAQTQPDAKAGKRTLAKLVRSMQKHGGESKDKQQKKGSTEAGKQLSSAMRAIRQGDYTGALAQLQAAEQSQTLNAKEYQALARAYTELGMPDEALRAYEDWSRAHPDDAQAYLSLARAYESMGMNADAAAQLALYQERSGNSANSYQNSASVYRRLGMTAEEGALLTDWVSSSPSSTQAHMALADYYRRTGNLGGAASEYQQVLQTSPGSVSAHMNLAQTYQQMGDHAGAQSALLSALQLQPGNADLYLRLGESYRRSGDVGAAISTYQSVVAMEPGTTQAMRAQQQIARLQRQAVQAGRAPKGAP